MLPIFQRAWLRAPATKVLLVELLHQKKMLPQWFNHTLWEHGYAILLTLAAPYSELFVVKVAVPLVEQLWWFQVRTDPQG